MYDSTPKRLLQNLRLKIKQIKNNTVIIVYQQGNQCVGSLLFIELKETEKEVLPRHKVLNFFY